MQKLALVAVLVLVTLAAAKKPAWNKLEGYTFQQYVKDFSKKYSTEEYAKREKLFNDRLPTIIAFNQEGHSWKKGVNHMSDWTETERKALNGVTPKGMVTRKLSDVKKEHLVSDVPLPNSVDYRHSYPPVLSAVKDQGKCGSCWAHAATEQLESHWALATGELFTLSQQQITACTPNPNQCGGTGGCNGATAELAFDYVLKAGGITQEWQYGYQSFFGEVPPCAFNATKMDQYVKIGGYTAVSRNDAGAVLDAVARAGPLAISVQADNWGDYDHGVFSGCNYAKNITMDHAVQLVGYGTDSDTGLDYWLVRNSWSPAWGESGFIRLIREKGAPECGWNNDWVAAGGGCKGEPNTVWACGQCGILYDTVYPNVEKN